MAFHYFIIHRDQRRNEPSGLFAYSDDCGRMDLIGWDYLDQAWLSDSDLLRYIVKVDSLDAEETARARAEELAIELGMKPLPGEAERRRITDEAGRRKRMLRQPPRHRGRKAVRIAA